jgi:hypothetical protein
VAATRGHFHVAAAVTLQVLDRARYTGLTFGAAFPLTGLVGWGPACGVLMRAGEPVGVEFRGEGAASPKVSLGLTMPPSMLLGALLE